MRLLQPHHAPEQLDLCTGQGLREQVRRHGIRAQVLRCDDSCIHCVSQPEEPQVQVLHATMVLGILCHRQRGLVVNVELGRRGHRSAHFAQEVAHPHDLLASFNSSHILRFCGGKRDYGLLLTAPTDTTRSNTYQVASGRPAVVLVAPMVRIGERDERGVDGGRRTIGELEIECAVEVGDYTLWDSISRSLFVSTKGLHCPLHSQLFSDFSQIYSLRSAPCTLRTPRESNPQLRCFRSNPLI